MRFPHPDTQSLCFLAQDSSTLTELMGDLCTVEEAAKIKELCQQELPPITSPDAVAAMLGYNPGFIWSMLERPHRHYRRFSIEKGTGLRWITAPRVGLKAIQRWLAHHWARKWTCRGCVHGFVAGRSHVTGAVEHLGAEWVVTADIENFFPSIQRDRVRKALVALGYSDVGSRAMALRFTCLNESLPQGSPASPVLSNIVLDDLDETMTAFSIKNDCVYTRYADDLVLSGKGKIPAGIETEFRNLIAADGWTVSENKFRVSALPERLKVHGLLIHGDKARLTKGYRNRIRAYRHLLKNGKLSPEDLPQILGHLAYADFVEKLGR